MPSGRDLHDGSITQENAVNEHAAVIGRNVHLVVQPARSLFRERPVISRLMLADPIPKEIDQRDNLVILPDRQVGKTQTERERLDSLFAGQKLGVVQAQAGEFLYMGRQLVTQAIEVLAIGDNRRFPFIIGAIRFLVLGRVEFHEKFRREEPHHRLKGLFDSGPHGKCALRVASGPAGSGAVRSARDSHGVDIA
jgi:hypothetical protein